MDLDGRPRYTGEGPRVRFLSMARLGDDIDDFCIKCKRLTNHSVVSLLEEKAAKVRCRTCYHDHDFRNEVPLPSKKELKKAQLALEALGLKATGGDADVDVAVDDDEDVDDDADGEEVASAADPDDKEPTPAPAKKATKKAAKKASKSASK